MLPSVKTFIAQLRALYAEPIDDMERFERSCPALLTMLGDPELKARADSWPSRNDPAKGHYENLLLYEDPDYGFVINALVKEVGEATPIHDHGEVLTVYGVLSGAETVKRYRRLDDGAYSESDPDRVKLELVGEHQVKPGYIDFVPPGEIHAEYNGPTRTIGIIVRNANVGKNLQYWYDEDTGTRTQRCGPKQVPYELV